MIPATPATAAQHALSRSSHICLSCRLRTLSRRLQEQQQKSARQGNPQNRRYSAGQHAYIPPSVHDNRSHPQAIELLHNGSSAQDARIPPIRKHGKRDRFADLPSREKARWHHAKRLSSPPAKGKDAPETDPLTENVVLSEKPVSAPSTILKPDLAKFTGEKASQHQLAQGTDTPKIRQSTSAVAESPRRRAQKLLDHGVQRVLQAGVATPSNTPRQQRRGYHATLSRLQQAAAAATYDGSLKTRFSPVRYTNEPPRKPQRTTNEIMQSQIRAQLRKWQEEYGTALDAKTCEMDLPVHPQDADTDDPANNTSRLGTPDDGFQAEMDQAERESLNAFALSKLEDLDSNGPLRSRFLGAGDLVELEFPKRETESILAVYIRCVQDLHQVLTMQGRWMHVPERSVQYSIPGFASRAEIDALIEYLPDVKADEEVETWKNEADIEDLSVPRTVSGPVVKRLVDFFKQSQEIYRNHASTLDSAHEMLAHETDLRYGSLTSAATALLRMPSDQLPPAALFTVRKALLHAGFAFNVDRRSHRMTGYLQIRSKEQVKSVELVRDWIRQWQDDVAITADFDEAARKKHKVSSGATIVYSFIDKATNMIRRSRELRDVRKEGSLGPSKKTLELTPSQDCVKVIVGVEFTSQEQDLVRFMEGWGASNIYQGLPRIESLPPLLLQATGMYEDFELNVRCGYVFLQELGTVLPYDNRVRFDHDLLLPTSQHSKPLQNLWTTIANLETTSSHQFADSMSHIRRDWKQLSVFCIDDVGAHEIDDGISLEPADSASTRGRDHWVHLHIANPTAFMDRDHPISKMARHMGETVYTPERAYMMMPRWASTRHFSLDSERPCLTFSAKLDPDGNKLEQKVTSGFIRNVMRLTPDEVESIISDGKSNNSSSRDVVITVGGNPPTPPPSKSHLPRLRPKDIAALKKLRDLAAKRSEIREAAGGVFFDSHRPDVNVWQGWKYNGLGWNHPHRKGSRIALGDPVIEFRSRPYQNWFAATSDASDVLVREMMLLACEIAASWCAERQIPAIFRGTVSTPDTSVEKSEQYKHDILLPAAKANGGIYPLHLGVEYIHTLGINSVSTTALKHKVLGMDFYAKATSPLRRFGDMILHWQIEAALREEARTGISLITQDRKADRSFLPFNVPTLKAVMLGLQPREQLISRAKAYAQGYWISLLIFRAHIFHQAELPKVFKALVYARPRYVNHSSLLVLCQEFNINMMMMRPEPLGLPKPLQGDQWECVIEEADVYGRAIVLRPVRLESRYGE